MAFHMVQLVMLFVSISLVLSDFPKSNGKVEEFHRQHLMKLLNLPQKSEQMENDMKIQRGDMIMLGDFQWTNCNKTAPIMLNSLVIAPDPIQVPGNITFEVNGITKVLVDGLSATVVMQKKAYLVWWSVPCTDDFGSCTYADVCSMLPPVKPVNCPFAPESCNCPFAKGTYKLQKTTVEIPDLHLPSIAYGDYWANIKANDKRGNNLACYDFYFSLKKG